jgi:DNA-binding NarL/FixJ family response regulator
MVADDHEITRDGIVANLTSQSDFMVVGQASDGLEAVERAGALKPDIVLMDLRMPKIDGVEAMIRIKQENPDIKFLVFTTYSDDDYIFAAIKAGAKGYLLKDSSRGDLFSAIRAVARGESLLQPIVTSKVLDRLAELSRRTAPGETLSEREVEVLRLMAAGEANKDIADNLSITQSTVKTHITSIFQKLNVTTRTEAVTTALKKGIIQL